MVAEAVDFLGGLDVAVANSGVASRFQTVAELDPKEWRRVTATDLDGAFFTAKAVVPHVRAKKGVVLFISSVGADMAAAGGAPYHASTAAVNVLTRVLAKELASDGVRVNCIAPGLVRSDMGNKLIRSSARAWFRRFRSAVRASLPTSAERPCSWLPPTARGSPERSSASTAVPACRCRRKTGALRRGSDARVRRRWHARAL
jgi:NAD(P)-dependent dehydrogenase (short-subunit alcohol dehydrogenase family)